MFEAFEILFSRYSGTPQVTVIPSSQSVDADYVLGTAPPFEFDGLTVETQVNFTVSTHA